VVPHNVELNGGVRVLYNDLELPICPDVFHQPLWNHSLRSAGCIHTSYTVSWHAVHRRA
jgi:hypothetical protein